MIKVKHKGDFTKLTRYFEKAKTSAKNIDFDRFGKEGVEALASATPVDSGTTAQSWYR